ncbi:cytochrome c oxidase subunit I [Burkholderia vietnamiensis]|uniref:cytochrome c oxidase subunit I n=1 Tax=Burkholderia vietnamiensis TaxID=60552 RepID=UPI000D78A05F|nr:cytochrome c oxidase subunit I [Burkholderia vietnamiensis]GBH24405.1 hypothetical protein BvRS1_14540 [Burkholderia vietnamiensis]
MAVARDTRPALSRVPDLGDAPPGSKPGRAPAGLWESAPGWRGWLGTVDHKRIGIRYIVTAFAFLLLGGVEALVMRIQLARPNATVLTPAQYDSLFTMHGVTMIFLYALPVLSGFANYLWPLMLGSRDMAFPRLNAFSYWVFLFAGLFLYASFPLGAVPDGGWFNYVPLTSLDYSAGANIDIYALGMILLGISTTGGAANFVVTLLRMRAHGMSIDRLPIIVWGTLTASVANLVAVPSVSLAFLLLWLDRNAGTHFFDVAHGGRPLLWQHLFWMFAHPWVYVVVLPAMGIVSDALPTFCRRPLVAYEAVAVSTVATMLIGFEVWVHHMFATGIAPLALAFFGAASMLISIPSAVAVFAWIATIWTGRPVFRTPFLYFAGFVLMFVIGGVPGVMTAAVPLDWQLTDTYFVVAHLHYVLLGINVFPVLGGVTYWFPKFTGRMMNERFGRLTFWVVLVGFNLGFFPMHVSGLLGMPRRVYTYPSGMGWDTSNLLTTIGSFAFGIGIGIVMFVVNALVSARRGQRAGANPWGAAGLEWSVASPAPAYNFAVLPLVASRHPLWETRDAAQRSSMRVGYRLAHGREALAVTPLAAKPSAILKMPDDSCAPFVLALLSSAVFAAMLARSPALVCADGSRLYPAMRYPSFAHLSDADVRALYAYFMRGVAPSANAATRTELPFPFNQRWALSLWGLVFANRDRITPQPSKSAEWNRGAYLVQGLGHCGACHTPRGPSYNERGYDERSPAFLTGGINDHWFAPNLTGAAPDGLGRWSAHDVAAFLRGGHAARGAVFGAMAPVVGKRTALLTDGDRHAIAIYLNRPARSASSSKVRSRRPARTAPSSGCRRCATR